MEDVYRAIGTNRQAFHRKKVRYFRLLEEMGSLIDLVSQIRKNHPVMSLRKVYTLVSPQNVGRDRFEAYFRGLGYHVEVKRNPRRTTIAMSDYRFPNLIKNKPIPKEINKVWVSDITYFYLGDRFVYITFILDLASRYIIGYSLSDSLRTESTTIPALTMAISRRNKKGQKVEGLILHADGGGQYYSNAFQKVTKKYNFRNSNAYDVYENPHAERVNGIIKNEYLIPYKPKSLEDLKIMLTKSVTLYNEERPHLSLGMISPSEYESKLIK